MTTFGVGIYLLTIIWCITFMLCWVSVRTGHYIGKVSILISIAITIILLLLPKEDGPEAYTANFYDKSFVPRFVTLSFLVISLIAGIVYSFVYVCLSPVETRKINRFGTNGSY